MCVCARVSRPEHLFLWQHLHTSTQDEQTLNLWERENSNRGPGRQTDSWNTNKTGRHMEKDLESTVCYTEQPCSALIKHTLLSFFNDDATGPAPSTVTVWPRLQRCQITLGRRDIARIKTTKQKRQEQSTLQERIDEKRYRAQKNVLLQNQKGTKY